MVKRIYRFAADEVDGNGSMTALLGGKGAGLAEMATLNIPVPPGFTITTDVCKDFEEMPSEDLMLFMQKLVDEVMEHMVWLEAKLGYAPLVSVRSGAPVSMPGMMDTILNVGLTWESFDDWQSRVGDRSAYDSRRRLVQMMGSTAFGIDMAKFDFQLASIKKLKGATQDTDLTAEDLSEVCCRFEMVFEKEAGQKFPATVPYQLMAAIQAVFRSWMNPRAIEYRKINKIDASMSTAVTIQSMAFGNMGESSGTGVLFSRNAATGAQEVLGEFLPNAQGEDVVAGIRTPLPLSQMQALWPEQHADLMAVMTRLENHYRDMMDLEFTVQEGKLWLLQCRVGKRSALAAFKIAVQFADAGVITHAEAVSRVTATQFKLVRRPRIADSFTLPPHAIGKGASPGVATGVIVFTAADAVNCTEPCVLVTHETCPDDIAGMNAAMGILTATGGTTSHAAVVARAMDKPCVVGCTDLKLEGYADTGGTWMVHIPGVELAGDHKTRITIDGDTGRVWLGVDVPVVDASHDPDVAKLCYWAMKQAGFSRKVHWPVATHERQTVKLADFWGDDEKLLGLLKHIKHLNVAATMTIDATPPSTLLADEQLQDCFGDISVLGSKAQWAVASIKVLLYEQMMNGLEGLTLAGLSDMAAIDLRSLAHKAGIAMVRRAKNLQDLMSGAPLIVTPDFVSDVAGSQQALSTMLELLEDAGHAVNVMKPAVPLEYATFVALA